MATEHEDVLKMGVKTSDIYLCGDCGSLSLELPALINGTAKCRGCGWQGPTRDLIVQTFQHTQGGDDELIRTFMREFRITLAKDFSLPFGKLLYRWGFLGETETEQGKIVNPIHLKKYLTAVFQSSMKAIIDTREKIEKERVNE